MKGVFIEYPKCSTCRNAKKWLDNNNIEYVDRNIVEETPTYEELKDWKEVIKILKTFLIQVDLCIKV